MTDPPRKGMVRAPTGGGAGRGTAKRLRSAKTRSASSQAWLTRQLNDPFVAEAKARGYRSRAAFKLIEIDDRVRLLRRGARVIDLGCAPGGWLQVALERGVGAVAGVDLLPVEPLSPAKLLEGDFTDPAVQEGLTELVGGAPDVVLSDMAPNTIGHRQTDHLRIMALIEAAADFAQRTLKPGGSFVAKAFQGGETSQLLSDLRRRFEEVRLIKPKASRAESAEVYIVAMRLRPS
jgi:23S rRNA (uridine2552-2'-O)-methyltransferase